ncbi:hypothetical protein BDZ89DRAFT_1115099 [Hymenopellis radicata]|nr:hypothetical protein BDZ89DRAFT_1115099 [Hymenopellis radicata]
MPLTTFPSLPGGLYTLNAENDTTRRILPISSSPYAMFLGKTIAFTRTPEDVVLRAELKSFIATVIDEELHKLEAKIEVLAADLHSVQEARAATQAFRDAHVAIFPPVHSLPPEIISKIFSLVLGDGHVVLPACLTTAPWNLLTVCQYWRNIALSLPCLWSSFNIKRYTGPTFIRAPAMVHREDRAVALEVVKHLSLSGDEPLNFAVAASEVNLRQIPLAELIKQSRRWKDVAFIGSGDLYDAFPDFGAGRLKILHSLSIQQFPLGPSQHLYTEDILQKFAKARRLRRLTFELPITSESALTFSNPPAIAFPWSQLTYLKIISYALSAFDGSTHSGCYRLLEACPRLQTFIESYALCTNSNADNATFALLPGTPILNHQVRVLELVQPTVLSYLQCPDLRHLSLPPIIPQESADVVADFCCRSACAQLKKVDGKLTGASSIYFTTILLALASVEALTFEMTSPWAMELCAYLVKYITTMPEAAPRLRSLKLKICNMAIRNSSSDANTQLVKHLASGVRKHAFRLDCGQFACKYFPKN